MADAYVVTAERDVRHRRLLILAAFAALALTSMLTGIALGAS